MVLIFRDGRKRKCSCSDGSVADLTQRVCPQGLLTLFLELIFISNIGFRIHISKQRIKESVIVPDEHIDQATCACPEGFEEYKPEFRSHGLHKLCKGPGQIFITKGGQSDLIVMRSMNIESTPPDVKPGDAKKRPDCKCSNGTLADWNR